MAKRGMAIPLVNPSARDRGLQVVAERAALAPLRHDQIVSEAALLAPRSLSRTRGRYPNGPRPASRGARLRRPLPGAAIAPGRGRLPGREAPGELVELEDGNEKNPL